MNLRIALAMLPAIALVCGCQLPANRSAPEASKAVAEPIPAKPAVPEGPAPGSPMAKAQSQQLVRQAAESLNEGNEDKARGEIAEALRLDPESKLGLCLNRGVSADPVETLGRPFTKYTVRSSETLGRIAQRALGESCDFYLLARYNGIRVPKQLAGGQVIRIPGKVPLAGPESSAKAAPDPLTAPVEPTAAVDPAPAKPYVSPQDLRVQIDRHHRDAQAAFRRQDLTTAIREWDQVLALDPANDLARARRQEALELDRRIKQVK